MLRAEVGSSRTTTGEWVGQEVSEPALLCWRLLDEDASPAEVVRDAQRLMRSVHALAAADAATVAAGQPNAATLVRRLTARLRLRARVSVQAPLPAEGAVEPLTRRFTELQFAPQGLLAGSLLHDSAHPGLCHENLSAVLHGLHASQVRRLCLYRHRLEGMGMRLPAVSSRQLFEHPDIIPSSWLLPAYRLSLATAPEAWRLEIVGAALFETMALLEAPLQGVVDGDALAATARVYSTRGHTEQDLVDQATRAIEVALSEPVPHDVTVTVDAVVVRIALGFLSSLQLQARWEHDVDAMLRAGHLDPWNAMVRLVRRKGRHAVGYHGRQVLAGQPFDELVVRDPETFVQALATSRWVKPGAPDSSLLCTTLLAFGGPMFRVFDDDELTVVRRWIGSLPRPPRPLETPAASKGDEGRNAPAACVDVAVRGGEPPAPEHGPMCRPATAFGTRAASVDRRRHRLALLTARELYHRLLNGERANAADRNDLQAQALDYVRTWLARSAAALRADDIGPAFDDYDKARLRRWFDARTLAQAQAYAASPKGVVKSRDAVIDDALQLCPMVLVDGAWLARWTRPGLVDTPIGERLYKIYSDEIGNGDTRLNHPSIYRDLMAQMGVELPDFRSRAFLQFPRFEAGAFDIPAFWLCVSRFPRRFLPETLGLNLAMELSGVGGGYRTARDELRHHGFSTLFVDLHNTIDNVSSGHSALALQAIECHMEGVVAARDTAATRTQWKRVRCGFNALASPKRRWTERFWRLRHAA